MKINENELSEDLIYKINRLDNIENTYSGSSGNIVSYNGHDFKLRDINETYLRTVYNDNDILNLKKHLYISEYNYMSSFNMPLNDENTICSAIPSMLTKLKKNIFFDAGNKIIKYKIYDNFIGILTVDGKVYKVRTSDATFNDEIDALNLIKTKFIHEYLDINSIKDFELYNDGVLIATANNGVYYLNNLSKTYENKFPVTDVKEIHVLKNNKILCTLTTENNNIVIYDFETGAKTDIFNELKYHGCQVPYATIIDKESFYILGKNYSVNQDPNILHMWNLDKAGISYEYNTSIHPVKNNNEYKVLFIRHDKNFIYLAGLKNASIFIWAYDKNALSSTPQEYIINDFALNELSFFEVKDNIFYFNNKDNHIIGIDKDKNLVCNLALDDNADIAKISIDDNIFYFNNETIDKYIFPNIKKYNEIELTITNAPINNIDIFIQNKKGKIKSTFFDENGIQIIPTFYIIINKTESVIKILNSPAKKITMNIALDDDTLIDGIVINANRLYFK